MKKLFVAMAFVLALLPLKAEAREKNCQLASSDGVMTYTVVKGDCLWLIARYECVRQFNPKVDWPELCQVNGIENCDLIFPGQVLVIPPPAELRDDSALLEEEYQRASEIPVTIAPLNPWMEVCAGSELTLPYVGLFSHPTLRQEEIVAGISVSSKAVSAELSGTCFVVRSGPEFFGDVTVTIAAWTPDKVMSEAKMVINFQPCEGVGRGDLEVRSLTARKEGAR